MKSHLIRASLFLVLFTAPLLAASTGHPGSVPVLLGLDSVRKDLGLSKNQCARLDAIRTSFKNDARLVTERAPSSPVEKKAANATVAKLVEKYNTEALDVLTPAQQKRLTQIEHQMLGGLMLFQADYQKQLALTPAQVSTVGKIQSDLEAFASRITASFENGEVGLQERLDALRKYRIEQSKKALRVLTPSQRKSFENMQGNQFKAA